jgi:opacity protein-like surface antigen
MSEPECREESVVAGFLCLERSFSLLLPERYEAMRALPETNFARPFFAALLLVAASVLGGAPAAVPAAQAQQMRGNAQDTTSAPIRFSVEVNGGFATYGRFLEQLAAEGRDERELTSRPGLALSAGVGVRLFERNTVRVLVQYLPGAFEFQADTGGSTGTVVPVGASDFRLVAGSIGIERRFVQIGRFAPYASVGLAAGAWTLTGDEGGDALVTSGSTETQLRFGGTSGIGLRVRLADGLSLNLEGNALSLGSPFDGENRFGVTVSPDTKIDEPSSVRVLRFRGGLRYTF